MYCVYLLQLEALCAEKSGNSSKKTGLVSVFVFKNKSYYLSPSALKDILFEALIGPARRMDLLLGLPAATRGLKTRERQKEYVMSVHALVHAAFKEFPREKCTTK